MVNEGKSKKASKRLQKEADLVVSSWKLADQLYTSFYGDCWPGPGIYHLRTIGRTFCFLLSHENPNLRSNKNY